MAEAPLPAATYIRHLMPESADYFGLNRKKS